MASKLPKVKYRFPWSALLAMTKDPIHFMDKQQKEKEAMYSVQAPIKFAVVSNHVAIRHILQKNWRNYSKGSAYDGFRLMLGNGILNSSGKEWKKNRNLIQPTFSKENIQAMSRAMNESSIHWCEQLISSGENQCFEAKEKFIHFSLSIISDVMLGDEADKYKPLLFPIIEREYDFVLKRNLSFFKLPIWFPLARHLQFTRSKKELDGYIKDIIQSKKNAPDDSMFSAIVHATDKEGEQLDDQQLRDEFITLFATGFETAASALMWTLLLLAKEDDYQNKLYASIKNIDIRDLPAIVSNELLNAVVKESMRLFPPAWVITRKCESDDVINDMIIPKNTNILISFYHAHRDPEFWEDPDKFKPERFMEESPPNPSFLPFGIGPRMCIGNHFSQMEILLFIFQFIKHFKVRLDKERGYEPEPKITLLPLGDVWLAAEQRD